MVGIIDDLCTFFKFDFRVNGFQTNQLAATFLIDQIGTLKALDADKKQRLREINEAQALSPDASLEMPAPPVVDEELDGLTTLTEPTTAYEEKGRRNKFLPAVLRRRTKCPPK